MTYTDGFNRVRTVRPHRAPLKYIKKWPPTQEIALFFIVSPGRRWHVKKKIKNVESVATACSASARYIVNCVLLPMVFVV